MALFQRQPTEISRNLPYSLALDTKTILIVGLGNPGKKYDLTRHNVGFSALDKLAETNGFPEFQEKTKLKCHITEKTLAKSKVILIKPTTFMNDSGEAVRAVTNFYKIPPADIVCVYDELAIPFTQIRTRVGGESAGHNGVKSLIAHIGPDFGRVRIGVKNDLAEKIDDADFVLAKFTKDEQSKLNSIYKEATVVLTQFIYGGLLPHETIKVD